MLRLLRPAFYYKGNEAERRTENNRFLSKPFFHREQKYFVGLGLTVSVQAANYYFVLLVNETHLFNETQSRMLSATQDKKDLTVLRPQRICKLKFNTSRKPTHSSG